MASGFGADELRALYERYATLIHRRAQRLVGDDAQAWDIVQEVFRVLLEKGDAFRREARPMTFIYRVTTNVALNAVRAQATRVAHEGNAHPPATVPPGDEEARTLIWALAGQLDPRCLQVAALHFVEGLTQEEISEVTATSRKTIGKLLEKVRQKALELRGDGG